MIAAGSTSRYQAAQTALSQRPVLPAWETAVILAAALLYWTDLLRIAFPGTDGVSIEFRATHFLFYGIFAALLLRAPAVFLNTLRQVPLLMLFLALAPISALWSIDPQETVQRSVAVLGSSLFGLYLATQVAAVTTLRLFSTTAAVSAVVSFILIVAFPVTGLMGADEYPGVWRGAYIHKNGMGQMATLGVIISAIVLVTSGVRNSLLMLVGFALNLLLLAGSFSLTSQIVCMASLVLIFTVGPLVRFVVDHTRALSLIAVPLLLVIPFTIAVDDLFALLGSLGKDATLSSRLPIWQMITGFIEDRFWFGYGYEAFWTDANGAVRMIESRLFFRPHYSHNGYIEVWLALGAIGFAVLLALFAQFTVNAARLLYRNDRDPICLLGFVYVPMFLIQNAAESTILQRNSMAWSLFVMLYAYLALAAVRGVSPTRPQREPERRLAVSKAPRLPVV
jgi:exopolysaccharide production protein ExoQ